MKQQSATKQKEGMYDNDISISTLNGTGKDGALGAAQPYCGVADGLVER